MRSGLEFLRGAEEAGKWDPPSLFRAPAGGGRRDGAPSTCALFGSSGRAW